MLLRTDIIDGALMPGLKLKLDMLRERYDIGAAPLREALSPDAARAYVRKATGAKYLITGPRP